MKRDMVTGQESQAGVTSVSQTPERHCGSRLTLRSFLTGKKEKAPPT